jgi:hypothetical protein
VACKKDMPLMPVPVISSRLPAVAYLANEGNFGFGNADFSRLGIRSGTLVNGLFREKNSASAGDVMQSVGIAGGRIFLLMNNSSCIHVLDTGTYKLLKTVRGLRSPRYFCKISDVYALISDMYARKLYLFSLTNLSVTDSFPVSGWCEKMMLHKGKVYICNTDGGKLYEFDPVNLKLSDSITTYKGCSSLQVDATGDLWVLCSGSYLPGFPSRLFRLSVQPLKILTEKVLGSTYQAKDLEISAGRDSLWWLYGGVYGMGIAQQQMYSFAAAGTVNAYGLTCSPVNGHLWISDAMNYQQAGRLREYAQSGAVLAEYVTGIIPSQLTIVP